MKNYKVVLSSKAWKSLSEIHSYIALESLDLNVANSFVGGLKEYIENSLSYLPERFLIYRGKIRKVVYIRNRNYLIFFRIKNVSEIFILDVVNAKRYTDYRDIR